MVCPFSIFVFLDTEFNANFKAPTLVSLFMLFLWIEPGTIQAILNILLTHKLILIKINKHIYNTWILNILSGVTFLQKQIRE